MHFSEIIVLRGCTAIPMFIFGLSQGAMHAYILLVYLQSTFVHANIGWQFNRIGKFIVTPRFHHWHHGIDAEAIDVNFAIHFPLFDRLFGTYHLPRSEWPTGYGVSGHPVPKSYWGQFWYPLRKLRMTKFEFVWYKQRLLTGAPRWTLFKDSPVPGAAPRARPPQPPAPPAARRWM